VVFEAAEQDDVGTAMAVARVTRSACVPSISARVRF